MLTLTNYSDPIDMRGSGASDYLQFPLERLGAELLIHVFRKHCRAALLRLLNVHLEHVLTSV